jgi:hypothetical protein
MDQHARIIGLVEYREGDGANIAIRPGPCFVQETLADVTISWSDGDSHGSAAMPLADFMHHVHERSIELLGVQA